MVAAFGAGACAAPAGSAAVLLSALIDSKIGHHFSSTEFLSVRYFSNSSSTSHSLPANSSGMGCCG